jgi:sRNA-binding regulator protein Hfq
MPINRRDSATQNLTLEKWSGERCVLTVHLRNSIRRRGVLVGSDQSTILLDIGGGIVEKIQKKAIPSPMPPPKVVK